MSQSNCKKCNVEFVANKGFINFCSLKCRNSRVFTDKTKETKSEITKKLWATGIFSSVNWIEINNNKKTKDKKAKTWIDKYKKKLINGEKLHIQTIKKLLIEDIGNFCELCNTSKWLDNPITLEVHHIDGNNKNNELQNLQILCPNCHSQTDNYRAKNIKKKICNQLGNTL